MTGISTLIFAFLVGGLVFAAVGCLVNVMAGSVSRTLVRRAEIRRELSGDWFSRFVGEFQAFAENQGRAAPPHGPRGNRSG